MWRGINTDGEQQFSSHIPIRKGGAPAFQKMLRPLPTPRWFDLQRRNLVRDTRGEGTSFCGDIRVPIERGRGPIGLHHFWDPYLRLNGLI